jgi:hypothetical protein
VKDLLTSHDRRNDAASSSRGAACRAEALAKAGSDEAIPNSSPSLKIASLRSQ